MTVLEAAAWIGVPYGTPMSMPWCIRPHRIPTGLVTCPLTGQITPLADGVELEPDEAEGGGAAACAAWIRVVSWELTAFSASASSMNAFSVVWVTASSCRFCARAEESWCVLA